MFDIVKFGSTIASLRKNADMTQSELGDRLNLTRQAISRYEVGENFPDVSVISEMSKIFGVSLEKLISAGDPTSGEEEILLSVANNTPLPKPQNAEDVKNLAPYLRPSILDKLAEMLINEGIDAENITALSEFLSDSSIMSSIENGTFDTKDVELMTKVVGFLGQRARVGIFTSIIDGKTDWHMLEALPYDTMPESLIECAVMEGVLPDEALTLMRKKTAAYYRQLRAEKL